MLKQIKNLVLHDVPLEFDTEENNSSSMIHLKRFLLDKGLDYRSSFGVNRNAFGAEPLSFCSTPTSSKINLWSTRSSRRASISSILDVVDDGHALGLGNPKILQTIMSHLTIHELIKVRFVNLRWNVVACSELRSKLGYVKVPPSRLKKFTHLMRKNVTNPYASYAIRVDNVWDKVFRKFLKRVAVDIVRLRVRLQITEIVEFAKILPQIRNLKSLHVIVFDEGLSNARNLLFFPDQLSGSFESLSCGDERGAWEMGLYAFPKLEMLQFENSDPSYKIHPFYDKTISNIITAAGNLREFRLIEWNSPLGRICSKLGISKPGVVDTVGKGATAEELTRLFFHTRLRFHQIRVEVTSKDICFTLVSDIIHKSTGTLLDLGLFNENIFDRFVVSSTFRHLLKLRLSMWWGPVDFSYFSRQFPAICWLSLNLSNLYELETGQVNISSVEPCPMVRTLSMTRLDAGVDVSLLEKLAILFPNVVELFIEVKNGAVLEKIYEVYPDLTLLSVELNRNISEDIDHNGDVRTESMTNQSFTGVPDEKIEITRELECGCPEVTFPEETRQIWNIASLQNLTTLLLRMPNSVNNIALLEGISRLDNLKNLVLLPFYNEEEPVKWCLRTIADNFPRLRTLVTSSQIEYDESDLTYLFTKKPNLVHKRKN